MNVFIHPTAIVESDDIGSGTKVWAFSHISKNVTIGKNCMIGMGVYIGPNVKINDNCRIQNNSLIYEGIEMEKDVFLGPNTVTTNDFQPTLKSNWRKSNRFRKTLFKMGCVIGANTTIVCGITVGSNSFVGAGSVITKDILPNSKGYGNPYRQTQANYYPKK